MDLSVIIVSWNTRELLGRCLQSLQTEREELERRRLSMEIVVVDNASTDGSARMVQESFPDARLLANEANLNYAAATNQALEVSQGEYLLLLNPDTELPGDGAAQMIDFLVERPAAGAVAPALADPNGRIQPSVRAFPTPTALFGDVTGLARLRPRSRWAAYRRQPAGDLPVAVEQPMASCLMLRRGAVVAVGLLDERFPLYFNDVDFCYRLRAAGWEIWYDPRVRVLHHGGAATRQVRPRAVWKSHLGLLRFYRKHYRARMPAPGFLAAAAIILAAGAIRVSLAWLRGTRKPDG